MGGKRVVKEIITGSLSLPFSFFPPRQLFACLLLSLLPLSESLEQANTLFTYVSCWVSYLSLLMANIKNRKKLQLIQTIWDVMLYSHYFTFHWKLLVLVSRIQKSGTGDNNFGKSEGTFRFDRLKWPDRSLWTTFKAGPEYSGRTKPKWSVPFDEPTGISGILGWMESALE